MFHQEIKMEKDLKEELRTKLKAVFFQLEKEASTRGDTWKNSDRKLASHYLCTVLSVDNALNGNELYKIVYEDLYVRRHPLQLYPNLKAALTGGLFEHAQFNAPALFNQTKESLLKRKYDVLKREEVERQDDARFSEYAASAFRAKL